MGPTVLSAAFLSTCSICLAWVDVNGDAMTPEQALARYPQSAFQITATPFPGQPQPAARPTTAQRLDRSSRTTREWARAINGLVLAIILAVIVVPLGILLLVHAF